MNVGKSKVMRCSRYENVGRTHVRLNGKPLEELDCFKYMLYKFIPQDTILVYIGIQYINR